jgi:hypothetical protein
MSKRASKNSVRFSGKNWANGRMRNSKKRKRKKTKKEKQFDIVCEKFNFSFEKNNELYGKLLLEFKKIDTFKKRTELISKIQLFKVFCNYKNISFHIAEYFLVKYYEIDFYKEYPELFKKELNDKKNLKNKKSNGNRIADFMSIKILNKLKKKLKKNN